MALCLVEGTEVEWNLVGVDPICLSRVLPRPMVWTSAVQAVFDGDCEDSEEVEVPTEAPTSGPTDAPTSPPTEAPTEGPTDAPTDAPTEGPTDAPTSPPTEAPTEGNACNQCDPSLGETYVVTLSGLAGDLENHDGVHTVTFNGPCSWLKDLGFGTVGLGWNETESAWVVVARTYGGICFKTWIGPFTPCALTGSYSELACDAADCADTGSCAASAGATCVVS